MTVVVDPCFGRFVPRFEACPYAIEVHATAQAMFTAVEAVTVKEVRFRRQLEFIRALPGSVSTGRLEVPTIDAPLALSFTGGAVCWARGHPKKS
jgi:hypothetical protein